ncbi:SusC/RagA family TonB-linked outer membrane protein [Prolixibacteraceae bacterium JC049]|nr:SusC/RagA family TonB-linked outer membrane protein [Prolixibacteraceae bacterium JC049]
MRFFALVVIVVLGFWRGNVYSQSERITLKMSDVSLEEVLLELENKSNSTFVFSSDDVSNIFNLELNFKSAAVKKIIDYCLKGTQLTYTQKGRVFIIRRAKPQIKSIKTATTRTITGKVVDVTHSPIPGATLVIKGTTKGTTTNFDGVFQLLVSEDVEWIVCSFVGMRDEECNIVGKDTLNITLNTSVKEVEEVVVTALGIRREQEELGYSYSQIPGKEITQSNESNVINNLAGRVAGVQILRPTGGPAASTRVVIRGITNISGNNQPLYIIDGIPLVNRQFTNADDKGNGGIDSGDGISSINPDDIESVNVLKGAAATALYGTRAQNGVVLINTKRGKVGFGVEFDSKIGVETALIKPSYQKVYGQGTKGRSPETKEAARESGAMWGAKMDNRQVMYYDGKIRTPRFYDNYDRFYQTGFSYHNSLAFHNGNETGNYRISLSDMDNNSIIPNTKYQKSSISARLNRFLDKEKKWKFDGKVFYARERTKNRPAIGASVYNAARMIQTMPSTINVNWLKDYQTDDAHPKGFDIINSNPWWLVHKINNKDLRKRIMGFVQVSYKYNNNWNFQLRTGLDYINSELSALTPLYSPWQIQGGARDDVYKEVERNTDFLVSYRKLLNSKLRLVANAGINHMRYRYDNVWLSSDTFISPDLQNASSGLNKYHGKRVERKGIDSVYGSVQLIYNEAYFLEATGRNDWSSTLPANNNSYYYPSISASVLLSQVTDLPDWISYARVRSSWAQVGGDTDPYQLQLQYDLDKNTHGNITNGGVANSFVPNSKLKPLRTSAFELGGNIRFFNDRIDLDASIYQQNSHNQIIDIPISNSSGYSRAIVNAGEVVNRGVELELRIDMLNAENPLKWEMSVNYTYNDNNVKYLHNNGDVYTILAGAGTNTTVSIEAHKGNSYGNIVGYGYQRTSDGAIKLDHNGKPMPTDLPQILGNVANKRSLGVANQLKYKDWTMKILVDARWGGKLYSNSEATSYINGKHTATLKGRDEYYETGVFIPEGVMNIGSDKEPEWVRNSISVDPEEYYQHIGRNIDEEFVYSSDFVKLREIRLGYTLPEKWFKKIYAKKAVVALVLRNWAYLYRAVKNIDPESAFYTIGNGQGVEYGAIPGARNIGLNVSLKF